MRTQLARRVEWPVAGLPDLEPGDIACDSYGEWIVCPPGSARDFLGSIRNHTVLEHEDGTITVSPSILLLSGDGSEQWHGWLERGVWRW